LEDVIRDPGPGGWDANAHVRRSRATDSWDEFWVFKGTPASRLFSRAIPFQLTEAKALFGQVNRRPTRTELQTIGSCTRAVRRVEGPGKEWLRTICLSGSSATCPRTSTAPWPQSSRTRRPNG